MDNSRFVAGARKLGKSRSQVNAAPGSTEGVPADQGEMPDAVLLLAHVAAGIMPACAILERGR